MFILSKEQFFSDDTKPLITNGRDEGEGEEEVIQRLHSEKRLRVMVFVVVLLLSPGGVPPEGDEPTGQTDEPQWVAAWRRSTEYSTVSET